MVQQAIFVLAGIPTGNFLLLLKSNYSIYCIYSLLGKPKFIPPAQLKTEIQMAFNKYCLKPKYAGLFSTGELAEWATLFEEDAASSDTYTPAPFPSLLSRTIPTVFWFPNSSSGTVDPDSIAEPPLMQALLSIPILLDIIMKMFM